MTDIATTNNNKKKRLGDIILMDPHHSTASLVDQTKNTKISTITQHIITYMYIMRAHKI